MATSTCTYARTAARPAARQSRHRHRSRDEELSLVNPSLGFTLPWAEVFFDSDDALFTLTTELSGRGNSDTEDPLFRPARPWYSRDSVCFPRCSGALLGRPDRFAPSQAP